MMTIQEATVSQGFCVGCALCAVACPVEAISIAWTEAQTWRPGVNKEKCRQCGQCVATCPTTAEHLVEQAATASREGERFGLPETAPCFAASDALPDGRARGASGGALGAVLRGLLTRGEVQAIIASTPIPARNGAPHYEVQCLRGVEELERGRSSHYHPMRYDKALMEARRSGKPYALVGLPCVVHGVRRLPEQAREGLRYVFALACSHCVTGQFVDCLAEQEGLSRNQAYVANLRDKRGGIRDANQFNNTFRASGKELRRNRFNTAFTDMWRNYFFAQEACLYCADFYGAHADMSVKDAWGAMSRDARGTSLLAVRNPDLVPLLRRLGEEGELNLAPCSPDEVFQSQPETARFKHVAVVERLRSRRSLRRLSRVSGLRSTGPSWRRFGSACGHWRLLTLSRLSRRLYARHGRRPVDALVWLVRGARLLEKAWGRLRRLVGIPVEVARKSLGLGKPRTPPESERLHVLIAGGYGYGNVGDEAQLAANLEHWRQAARGCRITVLSPDVAHTERTHGVRAELAPRAAFFNSDRSGGYGASSKAFKLRFAVMAPLLLFNVRLVRAGLPMFGLTARQARLLDVLASANVLYLSGGGYLTGMTLSRLWDNMLLIRLADALGVPVVLSGQTIGVFRDAVNRFLARWGLRKARWIFLRDSADSKRDLASIGIDHRRVRCSFDDALFCAAAPPGRLADALAGSGVDTEKPYVAVNAHYWRQSPAVVEAVKRQMAAALDRIAETTGLPLCFVPMHVSDEGAMRDIGALMAAPCPIATHGYEAPTAIGVVRNASLCVTMKHHPIIFAMGGAVPTVSISLDDYYYRKNTGALDLFGQAAYAVHTEAEGLCDAVVEKALEVWRGRERVSAGIESALEGLRPRAGESISLWLKER